MGRTVFLAGASGAIGRRLVPLLVGRGHRVVGTTRAAERVAMLRALGAEPVIVNVFDEDGLTAAVIAARPKVVVHQLTDLPAGLAPSRMAEAIHLNARIREQGTRNLVQAARKAGAARFVAQSIAWAYSSGSTPHGEDDPLDRNAAGDRGVSVRGVAALEAATLEGLPLCGLVLRYGRIYGEGTGTEVRPKSIPLHVDAAAYAALCAVERGAPGAYNIAEPTLELLTDKAVRELGWRADFRLPVRPEEGA